MVRRSPPIVGSGAWFARIGAGLQDAIPAPYTFVLAVFVRDNPKGVFMLSPEQPIEVAEVLRDLADEIENRDGRGVML